MIDLNRAFAGEEPAFMDGLFPDEDWRYNLNSLLNWAWFWDRFCPHGFLRTVKEDGSDRADLILEAEAKGFGSWSGPVAVYRGGGKPVYYYWPYKADPNDKKFFADGREPAVRN